MRICGVLICLGLPALLGANDAPLSIQLHPPTVAVRHFDPANPPKEMKPLRPGEAAVTHSQFACRASAIFTPVSSKKAGDHYTATIRIDSITVNLSMDDVIYLPAGAPAKLIAHEQGHHQINKILYTTEAEDAARRLAAPLIRRTFTATGPTSEAASTAAFHAAIDPLNRAYMAATPARASTANDTYDQLTRHGTNSLPESDAIRRSLAKLPPATQPAQEGRP